jgi:hypothetical protein
MLSPNGEKVGDWKEMKQRWAKSYKNFSPYSVPERSTHIPTLEFPTSISLHSAAISEYLVRSQEWPPRSLEFSGEHACK